MIKVKYESLVYNQAKEGLPRSSEALSLKFITSNVRGNKTRHS